MIIHATTRANRVLVRDREHGLKRRKKECPLLQLARIVLLLQLCLLLCVAQFLEDTARFRPDYCLLLNRCLFNLVGKLCADISVEVP